MDDIDIKILNILQSDGRISMKNLAAMIPMSVPAVSDRVHKLEHTGVISGYCAKIVPQKVGLGISSYVLFSCNTGAVDAAKRYIADDPRISAAYLLFGRFTMILEVNCANLDEYTYLMNELKNMGTTESYLKMECVKAPVLDISEEQMR